MKPTPITMCHICWPFKFPYFTEYMLTNEGKRKYVSDNQDDWDRWEKRKWHHIVFTEVNWHCTNVTVCVCNDFKVVAHSVSVNYIALQLSTHRLRGWRFSPDCSPAFTPLSSNTRTGARWRQPPGDQLLNIFGVAEHSRYVLFDYQ